MQQQHQQQQNYHPNVTHLVPLSNYDVTELKLENGHLAIHGLGGLVQTAPRKPTWNIRASDTLESIVHQATIASSGGTWTEDSSHPSMEHGWIGRRTRSDSDYYGKNISGTTTASTTSQVHDEQTGYRDNDTTVNTWASFESPNTKRNDDDSNCREKKQDQGGDESSRSRSTRPRRIAAVHNQSERKRRDRINQKMKALQRLVPNASKTDKASMLDEVIKYLEQLQAQVQLMSSLRNNIHPQMMIPLGMQQQLQQQQHLHQMSILARMGMTSVVPGVLGGVEMGMGMLNVSNMPGMAPHQSMQKPLVHPNPASFLPPFMLPPLVQPKPDPEGIAPNANSSPLADPYCALLAQQQSMNMDLFNRMAALYRQQFNSQMTGSSGSPSESNH